jgi:hypothetical protein
VKGIRRMPWRKNLQPTWRNFVVFKEKDQLGIIDALKRANSKTIHDRYPLEPDISSIRLLFSSTFSSLFFRNLKNSAISKLNPLPTKTFLLAFLF